MPRPCWDGDPFKYKKLNLGVEHYNLYIVHGLTELTGLYCFNASETAYKAYNLLPSSNRAEIGWHFITFFGLTVIIHIYRALYAYS